MTAPKGRNPQIEVTPRRIRVRLRPDNVDQLALDFCRVLTKLQVRYALVSGYVAILLGRNRLSEDIDLFVERLSVRQFKALHSALTKSLECITPGTVETLHGSYLDAGAESTSVRYARPETFSPNVEMKFAQKPVHHYSLSRRVPVDVNGQRLYIGALEMGIVYKLKMGSEKDLADARWMYDRTRERLHRPELNKLMEEMDAHAEWVT
ncbi:MAG TPA: hypothetical protein VGB42_07415 [Candidatus Thermoplasmatota archaeon]